MQNTENKPLKPFIPQIGDLELMARWGDRMPCSGCDSFLTVAELYEGCLCKKCAEETAEAVGS